MEGVRRNLRTTRQGVPRSAVTHLRVPNQELGPGRGDPSMSELQGRSTSILRRNPGDWIALLGWALVIVVVLAATAPLDAFTQFGPGPGFFPRALTIALAALVLVQAAVLAKSNVSGKGDSGGDKTAAPPITTAVNDPWATTSRAAAMVRVAALIACLFAYAVLLEILGFALATAGLGFSVLALLGRPFLRAVAESLIATLVLRFAFNTLLNVQLPESGVGFLRSVGL
jgi:hypothetical protein